MNNDFEKDEKIEEGLNVIRSRRRVVWIVLFGYLPVMMLVNILLPKSYIVYFACTYLVLWAFLILRSNFSRCPKCNNMFHAIGLFANPWTRKCLHCSLPLKRDPDI